MDNQLFNDARKFFDSFCLAMKVGEIPTIMTHYLQGEETVQILSNGQIIVGYEQIEKEYGLFLDEVELLDFQVPTFKCIPINDDILMVLQLNGMARVRRSRVKLPYRGTGAIIIRKIGDDFKMLYEHFTLKD